MAEEAGGYVSAIAQLQAHRKGTAKVQSNLLVHVVVEAILEMSDRLDHIEKSISELKESKKSNVISYSAVPGKMGISVEARAKLEDKDKNA